MTTERRGHAPGVPAAATHLRRIVPLAGLAALFVGTRLALFRRFPPFLDESLYASWALRVHDSVNDRFVALAYGKLPLLSWLGAGLVFVGVEPLDAVRVVSVSAGAASMVAAGLLAAHLGGRSAGFAAAALYVVLPLAFVHDVIGIMEPLVAALLAVALYLQVRLAEHPSWTTAFLLGFALAGGLLTKETGQLALVLFPVSLLVFDWGQEGRSRRLLTWLGCALTAVAIAGVGYLVLTLSEYWDDYPQARRSLGTLRSFGEGVSHPLRWLEAAWADYRTELVGYTTVLVLLAIVVGIALALRRRVRLGALYLVWVLAVLAIDVLFLPNPFVRYLVPLAPLLAAFGGYGIVEGAAALARAVHRPANPFAVAALATVVVLPALIFDARVLANPATAPYPGLSREEYATGWAAGTGWRPLADELRRRASDGPIVVASYGGLSEALPLLLRHDTDIRIVRAEGSQPGPEATADYVIENGSEGTGLPEDIGYGSLRYAWVFHRPNGGSPIVLHQRGMIWKGRFYTSPQSLRAGLGLPDAAFDRFVAAHTQIRSWYVAVSSREQ